MTAPTSFAYQWSRGGADILGATASTYTLEPADVGDTITCTVTAGNSAGQTTTTSLPSAAVVAAAGSPPPTDNGNTAPLAPSAVFVGNPYPTADGTAFSATVTSDQAFTVGIMESADGVSNGAMTMSAAATKSTAGYTAQATITPTSDYAAVVITNGPTAMTSLSLVSV